MKDDNRLMRRALRLARQGRRARPNPKVGCVIARDGKILSEGFHARFGGPHAERAALDACGVAKAKDATVYVTLEPCCHTNKKTPPCAQALIEAGVARVVIGMRDPNPQVSGRAAALLRKAGVRVSIGVLGQECADLNARYIANVTRARPRVILKAAVSLDGRIETSAGQSKWITSEPARRLSRKMRAGVDALLVGVETVLQDNPRLTARGAGPDPVRVILDSRLRTPKTARVLDGAAPTLLLTAAAPRRAPARRRHGNAFVIEVPKNGKGLDLRLALERLAQMGIGSLLVEGGSKVHTSFLEAGLVDEVRLFMAPRLIGGAGARGFFEGRGVKKLNDAPALKNVRVARAGADILVTGEIR